VLAIASRPPAKHLISKLRRYATPASSAPGARAETRKPHRGRLDGFLVGLPSSEFGYRAVELLRVPPPISRSDVLHTWCTGCGGT
jgi:hypothetical protein